MNYGCGMLVVQVLPLGRSADELQQLRYDWFSRCEVDADLTGLTLEDQAETVLFRLVRGTGLGELAGNSAVLNGWVYRPLLEVERGEIRAWLESQGIGWREDSSNLDLGYRRNWIRNDFLPLCDKAHIATHSEAASASLTATAQCDDSSEAGEDQRRRGRLRDVANFCCKHASRCGFVKQENSPGRDNVTDVPL